MAERILKKIQTLSCPWCGYITTYEKQTSKGKGHHATGSNTIKCDKCNRNLKHKK